jgi:lipoprotein signal peptidase
MNVYTTINKGLSFTIMKNILIYFYKMRVFYIFIFLYIKVLKREQNKKERKSVNKNRCILLWNKKRSTLNVYICTA